MSSPGPKGKPLDGESFSSTEKHPNSKEENKKCLALQTKDDSGEGNDIYDMHIYMYLYIYNVYYVSMHLDIYYVSTMYTMHVCIVIYDVSMYLYIRCIYVYIYIYYVKSM